MPSQVVDKISQKLRTVVRLDVNVPAVNEGISKRPRRIRSHGRIRVAVPKRERNILCIARTRKLPVAATTTKTDEDLLAVGFANVDVPRKFVASVAGSVRS